MSKIYIDSTANVSPEDVNAMVLGGHGDQMIPLIGYSNVNGVPITDFLSAEKIEEIVNRTRKGGAEIVGLLKTGSAYYAPGAAVCEMVDSIVNDKKKILPCAAMLAGEYGHSDVFIGVPVKLGKVGVEEIVEVKLSAEEKEAFDKNVEHIKELLSSL